MASHRSTPKSVLDAPPFTPDPVWITTRVEVNADTLPARVRIVRVRPAFVGDVERDLLGRTIGLSRKGRKIRRRLASEAGR